MNKALFSTLVVIILVFAFSTFKNISHPLLWNDEGETIIRAVTILKYGYPKIHFGKNNLNLTEFPDKSIGVKESIDAWIHLGWGQYYFAVPGTLIASHLDNVYSKTAAVRIPFALSGFFGIFIFIYTFSKLIDRKQEKLIFAISFIFLETTSVFFLLNARNARQHILNVFLSSILFFLVVSFHLLGKKRTLYYLAMPIFLILLQNMFLPLYFSTILFLIMLSLIQKDIKQFITILISLIVAIPIFSFYESFKIAKIYSDYFNFTNKLYFSNILKSIFFLSKYDKFYIFLTVKVILFFSIYNQFRLVIKSKLFTASVYLSIFIFIYILTVSRIPTLFERYLLPIQPMISLSIVLDVIFLLKKNKNKSGFNEMVIGILTTTFILITAFQFNSLMKYFYELTHAYKGPLDYAIPYIQNNFKNTQDLTIATNYEEYVLVYYLNSRVTVGFVGNNLDQDSKIVPDIVIPRRGRPNNINVLNNFLSQNNYEKITFPVFDYSYNNIPEITLPQGHLYKTLYAQTDDDKLTIYIKK